jgi:tRNA(Arg) A34 adenosine deaminase TadA
MWRRSSDPSDTYAKADATVTAGEIFAAKEEEETEDDCHDDNDDDVDVHYMRNALKVARAALSVGEVPVGCVIVYDPPSSVPTTERNNNRHHGEDNATYTDDQTFPTALSSSVIVSHGANQVNATRDPTRHAELVALDRLLARGRSSDRLRLGPMELAAIMARTTETTAGASTAKLKATASSTSTNGAVYGTGHSFLFSETSGSEIGGLLFCDSSYCSFF